MALQKQLVVLTAAGEGPSLGVPGPFEQMGKRVMFPVDTKLGLVDEVILQLIPSIKALLMDSLALSSRAPGLGDFPCRLVCSLGSEGLLSCLLESLLLLGKKPFL